MNPDLVPNDDALEELTSEAADDFMERLERGEAPDLEAFVQQHPQIADVLRRLLPALQAMRESEVGSRSAAHLPAADLERLGRLGDFEIIREVGRGGMGVVYEAVQLSLGRRVALKVLPFAAMLDPHRLQRFQNEARAAACLHHGNIVPVFAVGSDRNVHFYAMQYIEGRNLAVLVNDLRRQMGLPASEEEVRSEEEGVRREDRNGSSLLTPHSSLLTSHQPARADTNPVGALSTQRQSSPDTPVRTAARLAVQAAEALHHAHQQGVVHRDVKPANIMVDAAGHVWMTDFGLAQVQSDPRLTTTGNLLGTLRYMSPEQASGEQVVDHRTDIYSLGVTLYELLALRPAFGGRDRAAVMRRIAQEELPSLRWLNPKVPVDLETIVFKATAKSPADRYPTAQAMADDLHRFLEDRPILAKRPSVLEKVARWSRRRRGLFAAAIAVLVFAVCGLTASTVLISWQKAATQQAYDLLAIQEKKTEGEKQKAREEEQNARTAYEAEAKERQRAEDAAWKARQVLNFFTQVSAEDFPDKPELRPIRRKLLEAALGYYQDYIEQEGDDPSVQAELVASQWRIASILEEMGAKEDALAMFEEVRAALRPAPGPASLASLFGMGAPDFGVSSLLTQTAVAKDLKLSDDQMKAIAAHADKRRESPWAHHSPAEDARRADEAKENEKACFEVLRPDQAKRLRQIVWQQRGAHVFADPDVADDLQLTPDQRERIHKIEEESFRAVLPFPMRPGEHRPDAGKRPEDFWKDVSNRLVRVLTEDQKAKWKEMTGEPFQGEVRFGSAPPNLPPGMRPGRQLGRD